MSRSHWKMMAGGLAITLGGLAAVAGVPGRCGPVDRKSTPLPVVDSHTYTVPSPSKQDYVACQQPVIPMVAQPVIPQASQVPQIPQTAPLDIPVATQPITPQAPQLPQAAPIVGTVHDLPLIPSSNAVVPNLPQVGTYALVGGTVEVAPMPRVVGSQVLELTIPAAVTESLAIRPVSPQATQAVPPVRIEPAVQPTPTPAPALPTSADPVPPVITPAPAQIIPNAPASIPAPSTHEKKLKVMLHMGDDRPRFEVRDGEEVYLKVICEKVDVKSPSDRGETMSTMRASGKVSFITPGGEGTCEELTVVPGTGQVIVSGKVAFKYNWGKVETTVSGDKMTFRLGSAPGVTQSTPTTVPASYENRR